jgi:hypothetical protein
MLFIEGNHKASAENLEQPYVAKIVDRVKGVLLQAFI